MGVTHVSAAARDARRRTENERRLSERHLVLFITSVVAVFAIALSYGGRLAAQRHAATSQQVRPVNLNSVTDSQQLEQLFDPIFTNPRDRQVATQRVLEFILLNDSLPNVGALAPVLTSNQLAQVKPSVVVRTEASFAWLTVTWTAIYMASIWAVPLFWWVRGFRGDYLPLAATHLLTALGFAVLLSRQDPLRDTVLFVRYTQGVSIGLVAFAALSVLDFRKARFLTLSYAPLLAALILSVLLIVFGDGPGRSNAKVNLGPVQPIEAIRLLLALFLAGYFARRWELLRQVRARTIRDVRIPGWLNLPKMDYVLPVLAGVAAALLFFFLQKDLGPALFISCVFLAMYAIARNRVGMAVLGLSLLVAGFYLGYKLNVSTTLAARVQMWQSTWDNGV